MVVGIGDEKNVVERLTRELTAELQTSHADETPAPKLV